MNLPTVFPSVSAQGADIHGLRMTFNLETQDLDEGRARQLTPERLRLFGCPCDWRANTGFDPNHNDALDALHGEWVRCVAAHSVSWREPAISAWVHDEHAEPYASDDELKGLVLNMEMRRAPAVEAYETGIGRLDRTRFLSPSYNGKHFSPGSLASRRRSKYSQFFLDLRPETIGSLFWSWFDDAFTLRDMSIADAAEEPLSFLQGTEGIWRKFATDTQVRVAMDTTAPIGFIGNQDLEHVVIDLHLDSRTAHAYPVTLAEAERIMSPSGLRPIKSAEYGSPAP